MIETRVATEITGSAEQVWDVLTDLPRFPAWNPFIRAASGTPAVGATLRVAPRTSVGLRLSFRPTVTTCDPPHQLRWRGRFLAPWLARAEHTFTIEAAGDGKVRLVQHETFAGPLARLIAPLIGRETRRGFAAMNQALKARVEHPS